MSFWEIRALIAPGRWPSREAIQQMNFFNPAPIALEKFEKEFAGDRIGVHAWEVKEEVQAELAKQGFRLATQAEWIAYQGRLLSDFSGRIPDQRIVIEPWRFDQGQDEGDALPILWRRSKGKAVQVVATMPETVLSHHGPYPMGELKYWGGGD